MISDGPELAPDRFRLPPGAACATSRRWSTACSTSVAKRYDLMNDLMSGGLHRAWKDALVTAVNPPPKGRPGRLEKPASGRSRCSTSPAAPATWRSASPAAGGPGTRVTVADINAEMLAVGRERAAEQGLDDVVTFIEGNAEALPLPDRAFDAVTIAFGIRNVPRIEAALAEAHRVLRIGGRFLCLEFSNVDVPGLDTALRPLFVQRHSRGGRRGDRRRRRLSLSGRVDPQVSESRGVRRHDARRRLPPGVAPADHRRHRRHPFRLAVVIVHAHAPSCERQLPRACDAQASLEGATAATLQHRWPYHPSPHRSQGYAGCAAMAPTSGCGSRGERGQDS